MNKKLLPLLVLFLCFSFTAVNAADVTINTSRCFDELDGSLDDADGLSNGIFTVNGNLTIAPGGSINYNDPGNSCSNAGVPNDGAQPVSIVVSGNMEMQAGSSINTENKIQAGTGGAVTITVGGAFTMRSPSLIPAYPGALISSGNLTATAGNKDAGAITINVTGDVNTESGSTIKANAFKGKGGDIVITGDDITINGNVLSQSTGTGTGAVQGPGGGMISITAVNNLLVNDNGTVSSRGLDPGADLVHLCGCNVTIYGLVESAGVGHGIPNSPVTRLNSTYRPDKPSNSTAGVEIWAANHLLIDNLNHNGQVNADLCCGGGTTGTSWIDLFSKGSVSIIGKTVAYNNDIQSSNFAVHANGAAGNTDDGGTITIKSQNSTVTATGLAVQADGTEFGGTMIIEAPNAITLNNATLFARGDVNFNGGNGKGGNIAIRSFQNTISWQNGVGDVRPTGGTIPVKGLITFKKCTGTVNVTGTTFPDNGAPATSPQTLGDECGGEPSFASYVVFCSCPPNEEPCTSPTADAGPDQNLCNVTSVTLAGNDPAPNTGTWTKVSGTGGDITDPSQYNTTVTGLSAGTYVFRWTIVNGECSANNDVQITIHAQPASDAGPDQILCNVTSATLAGNNPSVGTGTWTKVSGSGGTITNPSQYNTTVTGLSIGTYIYRWTVVNGTCSVNNDVQIIISTCSCLGGHTPGFWSNKNGQALITGANLCTLNSLCLRNANGSAFDMVLTCPTPTNPQVNNGKSAFKAWLLNSTAVNMAYKLSSHLAAMKLNVIHGFVNSGALVYAPGVGNTGAGNNYITIGDLIAAADAALCNDGYTPSGDPNRAMQEGLKNALDNANNNSNFVETGCAATARMEAVSIAQPKALEVTAAKELNIKASPNPAGYQFTLQIESNNIKDPVSLRIVDMYGRVIQSFDGLRAGQTLHVGSTYIPGIYMAQVSQSDQYQQIKLNKQ